MPCFKGLAVSIHTPDGPIAEYAIQKQTRASRISSYIPVPPALVPANSATGQLEQSTFAISVTLLTPGLSVPYSTPKASEQDPYPRPRFVGGLPGYTAERGSYAPPISPYVPRTNNSNETVAAYIYFDGRGKEEVATLLRKGEETWVNSRWVSVPASEGGGLAEREFLFREVGLERWLNGLDLEGSKNKAERIERRQRRLEKKRQKRKEQQANSDDDSDNAGPTTKRPDRNGVLRYGGGENSPVEDVPIHDAFFSPDSESEDEPPEPEAAGQIKVALFRVLASGEVKRGEYSPQFDAHDDDEGMDQGGDGEGGDGDIDHTTSFAKPKSLDPKSISTQTVTGIDPPTSPYAVFTFFYRSKKQLEKMGILNAPDAQKTPQSSRRKSSGPDFSKLGPLKSQGTVGYSGYRDAASSSKRKTGRSNGDAMDSDADDEDDERLPKETDDVDIKEENNNHLLSPEDVRREGEITHGVQKIKLKRAHSAEPLDEPSATRKSPHLLPDETSSLGTPQSIHSTSANAGTPPDSSMQLSQEMSDGVSSPFKRHRGSVQSLSKAVFGQPAPQSSNEISTSPTGTAPSSAFNPVLNGAGTQTVNAFAAPASEPEVKAENIEMKVESDEEL